MIIKLPALIDPHVHLRDMNWAYKATFASEMAAALAGGYWAVLDMPNTPPATVNQAALGQKLEKLASSALCDWGVYFGASPDGNWDEYAEVDSSICGLKIYNNQTTGDLLIGDQTVREQHYRYWNNGKVIAVHAEGETILEILDLVRKYRRWTHFCHISSAEEIGYLKAAKEEGLPISIGVTPHHLYLSQDNLPTLGSLGLMKPELKTRADCEALWQAVTSGVVDVIESDHAPHPLEEKLSDNPPYGVPGLETTLPLMTLAVSEGKLSLVRMIDLLSGAALRIWGIRTPPETYILVNMGIAYRIKRKNLWTACGWSPFENKRVVGKVCEVWIRGQRVFDGEQILAPPGFGQKIL